MKCFFALLLSFFLTFSYAQKIYQSANFVLHLKADSSFVYYPKEASLKLLVTGEYVTREDSLLLTTHQHDGETVIFAIYALSFLELKLLYQQKDYRNSLSQSLYVHKILYPNQKLKEEYYWEDYATKNYERYTFSPEGYRLSAEYFENGELEGKQLYFYADRMNNLQREAHYNNGNLHGKLHYYEPLPDQIGKLALVKKENYRHGKRIKSKTPATPPTFYTRHF